MKVLKKVSFILALLLIVLVIPTNALAADIPFNDVAPTAWYYQDIKKAVETGLINGRTPTTYVPDGNMTYSEAVKLAACMHEKVTTGNVTLTNGNPWYQSYVDYAKSKGIINEDFNWDSNATRAGYMAIFAKALPEGELNQINTIADDAIPDVKMSHAKSAEIYKLYRAGIVQGIDEQNNCLPDSNIKRSEVAAILTRMMDKNARLKFSLGQKPVDQKPVITKQPNNATYKIGEKAKFSIEATGENLKYQWYAKPKNGQVEKMPLATTPVIETRALTAADANTEFWCEVSNNAGKVTSNIATVIYLGDEAKPVITKQPSDKIYVSGQSVRFSIEATGENLKYQWYAKPKNGQTEKMPLATTPVIETRALTAADANTEFWCEVSNNEGKVTSNIATVIYLGDEAKPVITKQPSDKIYVSGQSVRFSIEATGENLKYQWYAKPQNGQIEKMPLATTPVIETRALNASDANTEFWCEVSNNEGKVTSNIATVIYLGDEAKPVITKQPSDEIYVIGQSVTFTIEAKGDNLKYQWYKQPMGGQTSKISSGTSPTLVTGPLKASDARTSFWCVVSNNAGSVTSNSCYVDYE